jgi:hypothetical protein
MIDNERGTEASIGLIEFDSNKTDNKKNDEVMNESTFSFKNPQQNDS